jgi:hypothetical protein
LGLSLVPTTISLTGVFFFNLGFVSAVIIKNMIFFVGLGNAMLPFKKIEKEKRWE